MKKILSTFIFLFACSLLTAITLKAQTTEYGIIGGANFATIPNVKSSIANVNFNTNIGKRVGLMAGIYINNMIAQSNFSNEVEWLYTQKGIKGSVNIQDQNVNEVFKLDYIEIADLFKYNFKTNGLVTPSLYVGPYVAFNINSKIEAKSKNVTVNEDVKSDTKKTDVGIILGGGLNFGRVDIGVRYGFGFIDIGKESSIGKNQVLSVVAKIKIFER